MIALNILTLLNMKAIGKKTVEFVLESEYGISLARDISIPDLSNILRLIKEEHSRVIIPSITDLTQGKEKAYGIINRSPELGISIMAKYDPLYPKRYYDLPEAPLILYAKGNLTSLSKPYSVVIIGTRQPSDYGLKTGERIAEIFAKNGFVIVSGLAMGCDTAAHKGCLKAGGITVAVMAGGLDSIYPVSPPKKSYQFYR